MNYYSIYYIVALSIFFSIYLGDNVHSYESKLAGIEGMIFGALKLFNIWGKLGDADNWVTEFYNLMIFCRVPDDSPN